MGTYEIEAAARLGTGDLLDALVREFHVAGLPLNSRSNVYENSRRVKGGPGVLFGITGYNSKAAAQFIQIHDSATLPDEGAVPELIRTAATAANFGLLLALPGRVFQRGIYLVNSSTGPTKTIGSADCWFDAQYI